MVWIMRNIDRRRYCWDEVDHSCHESFILNGYRHPNSSFLQCLDSLFCLDNNEVINFWTHFTPFVWVGWTFIGLTREIDFISDSRSWPLLIYFISISFVLFASSMAHAFNSMSKFARHACFVMDYLSLCVLSIGVALSYRSYMYFPKFLLESFYTRYFVYLAIINAFLGTLLSCETRLIKLCFLQRLFRLFSFGVPYLFDSVPIISRQFCTPETCTEPIDSQPYYITHFVLSVTSAVIYLSNVPERFVRGRFDVVGYSHQLFHILGGVATYSQVTAVLMDYNSRSEQAYRENTQLYETSVGIFTLVFITNAIVAAVKLRQIYIILGDDEIKAESCERCRTISGNNNICDKKIS